MVKKLSPDPDLEALIQELNTSASSAGESGQIVGESGFPAPGPVGPPVPHWSLPEATDEAVEWLGRLLSDARRAHASDLLIVARARPVARINGDLAPVADQVLSPSASGQLCAALVPGRHRAGVQATAAADFVLAQTGIGRFRCNVHRARGHWCAAIRLLPEEVPDIGKLNLPSDVARFAELEYGLVLVTGPTGSGKSTTLAALMKRILARRRVHAITIEDPVEYAHPHGDGVVEHIEIGRDAPTFAAALRSALRQDPDVLLIGEMRDPESISIAITAAETGHLVLSTLHTGDGPQTINRILDSYPGSQTDQVRAQLSVSLAGIVSQQLLPRLDGRGRVPAVEVLMATHAVRNLIRRGKIAHIRSQITLEKNTGMLGLDTSLASLVNEGLVEAGQARARARVPEEFNDLI